MVPQTKPTPSRAHGEGQGPVWSTAGHSRWLGDVSRDKCPPKCISVLFTSQEHSVQPLFHPTTCLLCVKTADGTAHLACWLAAQQAPSTTKLSCSCHSVTAKSNGALHVSRTPTAAFLVCCAAGSGGCFGVATERTSASSINLRTDCFAAVQQQRWRQCRRRSDQHCCCCGATSSSNLVLQPAPRQC